MALVVFTGGARSGKSSAAQALAASREMDGSAVSVVVFGLEGRQDAEFEARIARHRADRPATWETIEATDSGSWLDTVPGDGVVVIDCLGTLLGLVMDELHAGNGSDGVTEPDLCALEERMDEIVGEIVSRVGDTIVVTNEVGEGVVPAHEAGRLFRDVLGRANRQLVAGADAAYLCVCGRLIDLKELEQDAKWPED